VQASQPRIIPSSPQEHAIFDGREEGVSARPDGVAVEKQHGVSRRGLLTSSAVGVLGSQVLFPPLAEAALLQLPASQLQNRYILVRCHSII
jgi:hypothetical protein